MGNKEKQRRNQEKRKKKIKHEASLVATRQKQLQEACQKHVHGVRNNSFFNAAMESPALSSLSESGESHNNADGFRISLFNACHTALNYPNTSPAQRPQSPFLIVLVKIAEFLPRTHCYHRLCRNTFMALEGRINGAFAPLSDYLGKDLTPLLPFLTPHVEEHASLSVIDCSLVDAALQPLPQEARNQAIFRLYRCGMSVLYRHGHYHEACHSRGSGCSHSRSAFVNRAAVNCVITTAVAKGLFDVNATERCSGRLILHYACRYGDIPFALKLINTLGCDPLQPEHNTSKKTALHIAAAEGLEAVVGAVFAPLKHRQKATAGTVGHTHHRLSTQRYVRALAAIPRLLDGNKRSVVEAAFSGNHCSLGTQISVGIRSAAETYDDDDEEEEEYSDEEDAMEDGNEETEGYWSEENHEPELSCAHKNSSSANAEVLHLPQGTLHTQ